MTTFLTNMTRLLLLAGATLAAFAAPITYEINAAIPLANQGNIGFVEFQFNPGGGIILDASATVRLLSLGGSILGADVPPLNFTTGSLPGDVTLTNEGSALYAKEITFGTGLRFRITLAGELLDTPGGDASTDFQLVLYDENFNPLFAGSSATISIDTLGGTVAGAGSPGLLPTAVPEPGSMLLLSAGLAGLIVWKRRLL